MAIIKLAVVSIIINSSYVLIITTPSARLEAGGKRPPSCLGKHIIFSIIRTFILLHFYDYTQCLSVKNGNVALTFNIENAKSTINNR